MTKTGPSTVVTIRPPRPWEFASLGGLWGFRELAYFMFLRDVKVRYKQTSLGVAWAVIQPFLLMVVFSIFLGHLAHVGSDGLPYPLFAFSALVPWTLFSSALGTSTRSLVSAGELISKIYFPRVLVPIASVGSFLLDFLIAMCVLFAMMGYYGFVPTWRVVAIPVLTALLLLIAFSVAIGFSALNVRYRDIGYVVPLLTQLWLFATPIAYPSSLVPKSVRLLYGLNPMTGVIDGFRWALLQDGSPPWALLATALVVAIVLMAGSLAYFQRAEKSFADVI